MLLSGGVHLSSGNVPPLTCRYLLGRAWSGVFCLIFLEVVTIHKCHYLYCAALWLLGALQLYTPWPDVCECVAALSSEPAAQPSLSATHLSSQIHWLVLTTYSTPMKGTICHFFSCLKAMISGRNLRKSVPLPCSPSLLFSSQMSPFLNYRISSLFNTTYSPHVFWKCKISLCVCLQLSLFTHYSQPRGPYQWVLFHSWSDVKASPSISPDRNSKLLPDSRDTKCQWHDVIRESAPSLP